MTLKEKGQCTVRRPATEATSKAQSLCRGGGRISSLEGAQTVRRDFLEVVTSELSEQRLPGIPRENDIPGRVENCSQHQRILRRTARGEKEQCLKSYLRECRIVFMWVLLSSTLLKAKKSEVQRRYFSREPREGNFSELFSGNGTGFKERHGASEASPSFSHSSPFCFQMEQNLEQVKINK